MSETQVLVKTVNDDEDDTNEHEASAAQAADNDDDEDLEDGEIDDDDDDENNGTKSRAAVAQGADQNNENVNKINSLSSSFDEKTQNKQHDSTTKSATDIITIDLAYENSSSPTPVTAASSSSSLMKSKKTYHIEDDHASSIEIALANVLKKKGIDPIMPKVLESRSGQQDAKDKDVEIVVGQGQSRSSRRRKRKKQRDDKDKDRKEKKRNRYDSPEPSGGAPPLDDEDDMDDYEMLNVRGGSPPPITATSAAVAHSAYGAYKDSYDSAADSCSSYDSYESQGDTGGAGDGGSRRRRRGKKDRKRRSGRNRDDDRNRLEKRTRRDSGDDKHRQEPRKLELCKFYLMECCAKKEKCSYMHKDFPCKYYYLGMECVLNDACKFSHGEPLSEQLRNILLKHLETAPKEILGNFKRISRENAISLVTKRHEELCKKFSVDNTWSTIINLPMNHNRNRGGGGGAGGDHHNLQQLQQLQQQAQQVQMQQLQQQQMQQQQQNQMHSNIPSLLDMVINPPIVGVASNTVNSKADKQRKSRWADTSSGNCCVEPSPCNGAGTSAAAAAAAPTQPPPPSYLDLKNLTGILSAEHIDKLSQLGIVNLEQVDKLTFGQLNQIGLTIAEISEIQLNAINMAKLGVTGAQAESGASGKQKVADNSNPTNRDVDMRFLPSVPATTATTITTTATTTTTSKVTSDATTNSLNAEKDNIVSSNSSSNSSNPVVTVDYTQYLKDSNISFDRNDAYDDEKDEEQLVIDDYNTDDEENAAAASSVESTAKKEEKQRSDSFSNELPSRLRIPDIVNTLKNPFNTLYAPSLTMNESKKEKEKENLNRGTRDPRSFMADFQRRNPFKAYKDDSADESNHNNSDEDYDSRYQLPSLARSDRSRSRTPSQSSTPEASQSPEPQESGSVQVIYDRKTMYDFSARQAEEDELKRAAKSIKADKDMRFLQGAGGGVGSDIDLRLPFQPVTNYTPATEIDGSITSHLPMTYKVYVVDVLAASYTELRKTFKSDQTTDPRLRRILGLPELSQTKTSAALSRTVRKLSNSIASPSESEGASPKYYTPPSSISDDRKSSAVTTAAQPRMDPRRAAAAAAATITSTSSNNSSTSSSGAIKQNVEIRNLLQKSDWYKNLNSKFKIMVNQQLAIVSTELKKFHQDDSSNKIFDITFIVTNSTLQQILTHLGIFINDNGEVEHVDPDSDEPQITSNSLGIALPNLSQPPPQQQQMNFLRAPPPNLAPPHLFRQGSGPPPSMNMTQFGPPPNSRPSLLGLPPGAAQGNPFNPFAGNMPDMGVGMNPNFVGGTGGGPGLIGAGPINFGNFGLGMPPNMQQRNFNLGGGGGNQQRGHRNQNRRNNFNGGGGNIL